MHVAGFALAGRATSLCEMSEDRVVVVVVEGI